MSHENNLAFEILESARAGRIDKWWEVNVPLVKEERFPWKEREILPRKLGKMISVVELMGPSGSGKTSGLEYLEENFPEAARLIVKREFVIEGISGWEDVKDVADVLGFERALVFWQKLKMLSVVEGVREAKDMLLEDVRNKNWGGPILVVCDRGPNDVFPYMNWIREPAERKRELPKEWHENAIYDGVRFDSKHSLHPEFDKEYIQLWFEALKLSEMVDATALYPVRFETAKARRVARGQRAEGDIVNSQTWPVTIDGYSQWMESYYPLFRDRYGTGLLVVNEELDERVNRVKLLNYCRKIVGVE